MIKQLSILYRIIFKKPRLFRNFSIHRNRDKHSVNFPHDESFLKDQEVQWWYWTGHLTTENGKKYGYEVCFFVFDSWIFFRDILAQVAITDESGKKFHYREDMEFMKLPKKLKDSFILKAKSRRKGNITATGDSSGYNLNFDLENMKMNLNLSTETQPVIHYNGKAHHFCYGGYTYYYSREKMQTTGTLTIDGNVQKVTGETWYDRQYGDLFHSIFKGWQWFAITLDDDRTIMLYDFTEQYKEKESYGSTTIGNKTVEFGPNDFNVDIKDCWRSPNTENIYPIEWNLTVQGEEMTVIPVMKDQELCADDGIWIGPEYWEGSCHVLRNGKQIGKAYVELNGFGKKLFSFDEIFKKNIGPTEGV